MSLTPDACRAARGILKWSMLDLANKATVSVGTILRFERGDAKPWAGNLEKIVAAFARHGVQVICEDHQTGAVRVIGGGQ